jgi:hypothetical protein
MTIRRVVSVVTCVVVAVLGGVFAVSQWETSNRIATVVSALAGVAAVGVGIWAALSPGQGSRADDVATRPGESEAMNGGTSVTGVKRPKARGNGSARVEDTGKARADGKGSRAVSGIDYS